MKMMKEESDTMKATKKQNDDINADRLVVLEAKIGKIYELLPEDFKFPETDEKAKRYVEGNVIDIDDQEQDYLDQVSDRVYEKLLRDEARLITNDQYTPGLESPYGNYASNRSNQNDYFSYDNSAVVKKKPIIKPRKMSPKPLEKNANYTAIYKHEIETTKFNYAKAPKLSERNKDM